MRQGRSNADRWEKGFAALSRFRARKGHCLPSRRHVEGNFNLGPWVSTQRSRKDLLPLERKRRLDAIGFVWDWIDYRWEQGFTALLKFKSASGQSAADRGQVAHQSRSAADRGEYRQAAGAAEKVRKSINAQEM